MRDPQDVQWAALRAKLKRDSTRTYRLSVMAADGRWQPVCDIHAPDHATALGQAVASLAPEHSDQPIRFESEDARPGPTA